MRNRKFKKNNKKIQKIKKYHMNSFQAIIDWKKADKERNKNYRSVPFLPDA